MASRVRRIRPKKLFEFLEVPWQRGHKPRSEVALLESLIRHLLPESSDADVERALALRQTDASADMRASSPLFDERFADMVIESQDMESADIEMQFRKHRDAAKAKDTRDEHTKSLLKEVLEVAHAGAQGKKQRKFAPRKATGYTRDQATKFAPPDCAVWKDLKENRWRVRAAYLPFGKSKSWGGKSGFDDYGAMKFVLQVSWKAYSEATGLPSTVDFEACASSFLPPPATSGAASSSGSCEQEGLEGASGANSDCMTREFRP